MVNLWILNKLRETEMSKIEYVEILCEFKHAGRDSVLVAIEGEEHWIPRTVLSWWSEQAVDTMDRGQETSLKVAEWFAEKKGLV